MTIMLVRGIRIDYSLGRQSSRRGDFNIKNYRKYIGFSNIYAREFIVHYLSTIRFIGVQGKPSSRLLPCSHFQKRVQLLKIINLQPTYIFKLTNDLFHCRVLSEMVLELQRYLDLSFAALAAIYFQTFVDLIVNIVSFCQLAEQIVINCVAGWLGLLKGGKFHLRSPVLYILFVLRIFSQEVSDCGSSHHLGRSFFAIQLLRKIITVTSFPAH